MTLTFDRPKLRWRRRLAPLLLVSAWLGLAGCTSVVNPATGERQLTAMSPEQEQQVGASEHPKILQQFGGSYDEQNLQAYVTEIGEKLAAVSELPDQDFTFTLLNSDVVNAFALPGGYVYVSRGLLALAENEAEVAGVIAHEIGHVTARHSAQRYTRGTGAQIGLTLGTVLAGVFGGKVAAEAVQQLGGAGAQAYLAGYSREQEFQSDELGVRYLARAGYDPTAMASFLEKLGAQSELARRLAGKEGQADPSTSMFATHPRTPDRVRRAAERAEGAAAGRVEAEPYLEQIDGLVYGEDPSQGFVRGRTFVHPELGFRFTAPDGFKLINAPSAVIGGDRSGRGMKFDGGKLEGAASMPAYLSEVWAKELKIPQVDNVRAFEIDGMPAASGGTSGRTNDGKEVGVALAAIRAGDGQVYRFLFLSPGGMNQNEARAYQQTVESFERLSAAESTDFKPKRIQVVRAEAGDDAEDFARRMAVDDLPLEQFLVLNGLAEGEAVAAGSLVKIITE
jgi:predicted Zn-dependent protease